MVMAPHGPVTMRVHYYYHGMVMHESSTDLGVLEHAESYFLSLTECILNLDGFLV